MTESTIMTESLARDIQSIGWSNVSSSTLKRDVDCFVQTSLVLCGKIDWQDHNLENLKTQITYGEEGGSTKLAKVNRVKCPKCGKLNPTDTIKCIYYEGRLR